MTINSSNDRRSTSSVSEAEMPEPVAMVSDEFVGMGIRTGVATWRVKAPPAGTKLYTEQQLRAATKASAPADAPTINDMCERKTNHIMERDGYEKSGYVLRKAGADICVSDGGAVAWFTPEQWNWLMFNRMHTTFDWPKPIGWRAPAEDAREEVQDELLDMALEVLRYYADPKNNCPGAAARLIIADIEARRTSSVPAIPGTPEGFVLLPESPTNEMICAIEAAIDSQLVASAMSPAQMFRQDGERIYEALLEVVAPSHPLEAKAGEPCAHCNRLPGERRDECEHCPAGAKAGEDA